MPKTKEELNTKTQSYLEKGSCRHKAEEYDKIVNYKNGGQAGYPSIRCVHCSEEYPKPNFNYITPDGIAKIKDFLAENVSKDTNKDSVGFVDYFAEELKKDYFKEDVSFDYSMNVNFAKDMMFQFFNLSSQQFAEHFVEYMEKNK
jgi:hypothetical protein